MIRYNIPIGISEFEKIRKNDYYYVDKTELIQALVKTDAYGHFPRPSGPRSPARQGHIKRPVLRLAEPSFLRPANQCC